MIRRIFGRRCKRALLGCVVALSASVLSWSVAEGQGPETSPSVHGLSGFVGIASGQSARVNVVNLGRRPASVTLALIDMSGVIQGVQQCAQECQVGQPCPRTCSLQPGEAVALQLSADRLALGQDGRAYLRAVVSRNAGAQEVITTFEIFDNQTGRTIVVAPCIIDMN